MKLAFKLSMERVRFWLFVSLIVCAPLSKYPSLALPEFNFPSFRIGFYQILLTFFFLFCIWGLLKKAWIIFQQERVAFISLSLLSITILLGLFSALNKARSGLLATSMLLLIGTVFAAWWYVACELSKEKYEFLIKAVIIAGIIFGSFSILQFILAGFGHQTLGLLCKNCTEQIFGFPRINGFTAEPQFHANVMMVYFFIGLGVFYINRSKVALICLVTSLITIGLTFSRGAYLALLIGTILFYVLLRIQGGLRIRTLLLHGLVLILTALTTLALLIGAASYRYRGTPEIAYKTFRSFTEQASLGLIKLPNTMSGSGFKPAGLIEASADERLEAGRLGLKAWRYNLRTKILGVGSGNLGPFVNKHINPVSPNNLTIYIFYLLILSELGIVGLLAISGLFISALAGFIGRFWSHKNAAIYTSLFCLGVAFFIQLFFFGSYINVTYIWLFFGIILGLGRTHKLTAYNKST